MSKVIDFLLNPTHRFVLVTVSMTSIELNETCDTARVTISWDAVCQRYAARFCEQFQGKRKVYLLMNINYEELIIEKLIEN